MPSAVTLQHPEGPYVEVRPEDVEGCLERGFKRVTGIDAHIPDINHNFVHTRIDRHVGRHALVIGNGPSVRGIPPQLMQAFVKKHDALVIGTNNMFDLWGTEEPCPCHYWVILDKVFWWNNKNKIHAARQWMKEHHHVAPIMVFHFDPQQLMIYERIVVDTAHDAMFHPKYEANVYPHGESSGVAAINHALHMGCSTLYLTGHDLKLDDQGNTHGHGVRDEERRGYTQGEGMLPGYEVCAMWARQLGRKVWNMSPISVIPSFPFTTVGTLMKG